jgi:hypothetical protein
MRERNRSLTELRLFDCRIRGAGLERLGEALTRNTTLRELDVGCTCFGEDSVSFFADMMGDMHGLQVLKLDEDWNQQLLPGIECNYSLLELDPAYPAAQPYLARNACGYAKAYAATLAWLCISRLAPPNGITRDIGRIIARHIYASRGRVCWIDGDDNNDDDN